MSSNEENSLYLLFQNGNQYFAVPIGAVVEVIKSQSLSPTPVERENLNGLLNLRGDVLPILNLPQIEISNDYQPQYIVIAMIQEQRFGFQVEKVHQVISFDIAKFQKVNGTEENQFYYQMDNKTVSVIKSFNFIEVGA